VPDSRWRVCAAIRRVAASSRGQVVDRAAKPAAPTSRRCPFRGRAVRTT
jgi:hypothetical protein